MPTNTPPNSSSQYVQALAGRPGRDISQSSWNMWSLGFVRKTPSVTRSRATWSAAKRLQCSANLSRTRRGHSKEGSRRARCPVLTERGCDKKLQYTASILTQREPVYRVAGGWSALGGELVSGWVGGLWCVVCVCVWFEMCCLCGWGEVVGCVGGWCVVCGVCSVCVSISNCSNG